MPPAKKAKTEGASAGPIVYHEPKVMAEIGCNHMGQLEIAKELLTLAKECGCEYGKFQKRCPKELLTAEQYAAPHPNPRNSYGDTYGAHREYLELTVDQHRELKKARARALLPPPPPPPPPLAREWVGRGLARRAACRCGRLTSPRPFAARSTARRSGSATRARSGT